MSWSLFQERLLIYDDVSQYAFMPLGEDLYPEELVILSLNLKSAGLSPNFCLATEDYVKKFPEIENYYKVKPERDHAEYIYTADSLSDLNGTKLHKKRNLISQFKRSYPEFQVHRLENQYLGRAWNLAKDMLKRWDKVPKTLEQELSALEISLGSFEQLGLEGLAITIKEKLIAFSVFSALSHSTYDIQFEKSDISYKGAAQVINHETAGYLKNKCRFLNREQDLGVKGLRQAKLSYDPVTLITPYSLTFNPVN